MLNYMLVASKLNGTLPCYFVGYIDHGAMCEAIWTNDCLDARQFERDDAELEAKLLGTFHQFYLIEAQPVSIVTGARR